MHQNAALIQTVLEGVPLPATKKELIDYARSQDAGERVLGILGWVEDREYASLDEVGEEIVPVQPKLAVPNPERPPVESDLPPGGSSYTDPHPTAGAIRDEPDVLEYEQQLVREP
jgi:hypothetical protein